MVQDSGQDGSTSLARVFTQNRVQLDHDWERFLGGAARETLAVRSPILDSWERCRSSKVDLGLTYAPLLARDAIDAARHEHRSLLRASAQILAEAADVLGGSDTIMLLTDPRGVVLHGVGDTAAQRAGADIALTSGGVWGERAAGTNGIGVAARTNAPTLVHAGEHYCERMKTWSCAASPVIDPCDGTVAGILNISARSQFATSQIFALSLLGARRIEQALLHQTDELRARLLEAVLDQGREGRGDGMIAFDARGRLAYASSRVAAALRRRLGITADLSRPGAPLFRVPHQRQTKGVAGLEDLPAEWVEPIRIDGEVAGYMLILPDDRPVGVATRVGVRPTAERANASRPGFGSILGTSTALRNAIERARAFAPSPLPVLVEGETGTGKELFARAIHDESGRTGAFTAVNCGAIGREMIASELFGYAPGSFTGAVPGGRAGRFELANGGTLCLDEVGELPLDIQPYLLRVLEEGVVNRVGAAEECRVDVRVIAMTNRDLRAEVEAGRFRRDLYHRLAVATVTVPPLRDRGEDDVRLLIEHFAEIAAVRLNAAVVRFTPPALARVMAHSWPGNVRELRNLIDAATLLAVGGVADQTCLPRDIGECGDQHILSSDRIGDERELILSAIAASRGNMSVACVTLGMSRSTLYRRLRDLCIERDTRH